MSQYLDNIDNDIAEKHLLKHPFYLAWTRGELSKEALGIMRDNTIIMLRRFRRISQRCTRNATTK